MSVSEQRSLELIVSRPVSLVSEDVVAAQANEVKAFNTQIDLSGLQDQSIYLPMGVDSAQFSRWKSGQQTPQFHRLTQISRICGNPLVLQKLAWDLGFGMHLRKTEAERRAEAAEARAIAAEEKLRYAEELLMRPK